MCIPCISGAMMEEKAEELVEVFIESLLEDNPKLTVKQLDALFSLGRERYWNKVYQLAFET